MERKSAPKRSGKSMFRKVNDFLHLWLGLISGLIVFIVSITGCIYVFEHEIRSVTQPYQYVEKESKPYLPPSALKAVAASYAFGNVPETGENRISGIQYPGAGYAATATFSTKEKGFTYIFMNPYTGAVIQEKMLKDDFFRIILMGHYYLWLPPKIGQPVVAISILIFVIMLITGFIMWWPKNLKKANADKSFKIKWTAKFKRLNYDLHNVLGFYVGLVALIIAMTGLVWGFKWFAKSVYWTTSGGKSLIAREKLFSDTTNIVKYAAGTQEDKVWDKMNQEYKGEEGSLQIQFPEKASDVIGVTYNPGVNTYYKREFRRFDRYTLKEIKGKGVFAKKFSDAAFADKLNRMNYDIHVGAILGLPGKIIAFIASLICASLPITGFLVWFGKRNKKKKAAPASTVRTYQSQKTAVPV